jgi:hypothetical protein
MKMTHTALSRLKWQACLFCAVSSGFLFADIAGLEHEALLRAQEDFRKHGGYNTNYYGSMNEVTVSNGLTGNLEQDLHDFPLHLAAAFDELFTLNGVSSLLSSGI